MSLDAGRTTTIGPLEPVIQGFEDRDEEREPRVFDTWKDWEPSRIAHHGRACCEISREWIINTDLSSLNGANPLTGPRWLRHRFEWGPGTYPLYWCELPAKSVLDCGILAAISFEIFVHRGVPTFRAQLIQEFADSASTHWRRAWENDRAHTSWIDGRLIYHEGCAVMVRPNELKLWDSSAGWWVDPKAVRGYGSVLAVRIAANSNQPLRWGDHELIPREWTELTAETATV